MEKILPFLSRSASLFLLTSILMAAPLLGNIQSALAQGRADTAPPDTIITSSVDGNGKPVSSKGTSSSNSITFTYRGTDNTGSISNFQCSLDNRPFASCGSQVNYPSLTDGGHSFSVVAIDSSGNVDKSPAFFTWVVNPSPDPKAADPKVTQRAEINAGGLESGQRSLQAAACNADICVVQGQAVTYTYHCDSRPDPRPSVKCVMLSGPPGATFTSTVGNPATGTLTWPNAGPPGTYQVRIQSQHVFCPSDITCTDSDVFTTTIMVTKAVGKDCGTNYIWDKEKKTCVPDCENHPDELGCNPEPPTYCDNNPSDPECKPGKSKFCEENPNHVYCDPNVVDLCNRNPEMLHCAVFLTDADLECIAQGGLLKPGRICDFEAAQEKWDASVKKACRTEPTAPLCQGDFVPENRQILDYCRNASPFNAFCRALDIAPAICYVASAPGCDYYFDNFCKFDPNAEQCKPKGPK